MTTVDVWQSPTPLDIAHTHPWMPWLLGVLITAGIVAGVILCALAVTHWLDYLRRRRAGRTGRRVPGPQERRGRPHGRPPV